MNPVARSNMCLICLGTELVTALFQCLSSKISFGSLQRLFCIL